MINLSLAGWCIPDVSASHRGRSNLYRMPPKIEVVIALSIPRVFRIAPWRMFHLSDEAKNLERDTRLGHGWTRGTQYGSWRLSMAAEMYIEIETINIRVSSWTIRIIEVNWSKTFFFFVTKYVCTKYHWKNIRITQYILPLVFRKSSQFVRKCNKPVSYMFLLYIS